MLVLVCMMSEQGKNVEINKDTFCVSPFTHQSTKTDGSIKACCRALPAIGNIKKDTMSEAWNHRLIKQLRLDLLNGVRNSMCDNCWNLEDSGVRSLRHKYSERQDHYEKALKAIETMHEDGHVEEMPAWIEFKLSNLCNLKCRMCHPIDSTKWRSDYSAIEHLHEDYWQDYVNKVGVKEKTQLVNYNENFFNNLKNHMTNIDTLAFAGGEPFMDENHYRILDIVKPNAQNISLRYATNMTMFKTSKYNAMDYLPYFKDVVLAASLDGPPRLNEYIRGDSNSDAVEENIKIAKTLTNTRIYGKITVQALNIYYVPEALEWFKKMELHTDQHFVTWPNHLDARIWQGEARQLIVDKLTLYIDSLDNNDFNCKRTANDILKFFSANEMYTENKFWKFVEWNKILNNTRKESHEDFDFLKEYMRHE